MANYKVLGDRILVQRDLGAEEGYVLMPQNVKKKPKTGTVLSVGSKVEDVQVGDRVVFNEYAGYFLETNEDLEESDFIVMREDEVLAIEQANTTEAEASPGLAGFETEVETESE